MKFLEVQRNTKFNSFLLAGLFCLNVLVLSVLNAFAMGLMLRLKLDISDSNSTFLEVAIFLVSIIVLFGTALYMISTNPQGPEVAEAMGARLLKAPLAPEEIKLQNIVEEMSIASGVPLPYIYVLDHEEEINAFTSGADNSTTVLCVTKGALKLLNREELQGVIGHEFSHILKGDLSFNLHIAAVVKTFFIFQKLGRKSLAVSNNTNIYYQALGLILLFFGSLGFLLGRIIQSLFSQQRELLADASGVQFTRNPDALARALAKISQGAGSQLWKTQVEYAHIFIANGSSNWIPSFLSSHPPLINRIEKIIPNQDVIEFLSKVQSDMTRDQVTKGFMQKKVESVLKQAAILRNQEQPAIENLSFSRQIVAQLEPIKSYLYDPHTARGTLALVIFYSQPQYEDAKVLIKEEFQSPLIFEKVAQAIENHESHRMALFFYAVSHLRNLPLYEKKELLKKIADVLEQDHKWTLLEALLYLNAQLLLLPAMNTQTTPTLTPSTLKQQMENPRELTQEALNDFVYRHRSWPLQKKIALINELTDSFQSQGLKEELRLLCLTLQVPISLIQEA